MQRTIYLDHHATTPLASEALAAMRPYLEHEFGNPSSAVHGYGQRAAAAVLQARAEVAQSIGAQADEIVFTSGATESDNLAILGYARAQRMRGDHVITCATEHRAVLDPCLQLQREGFRVTVLPVERSGRVNQGRLAEALEPSTLLVSLMHGNNEIGVLHALEEIAALCRARGVALHSDATQALGRVALDVQTLGLDMLSLTAHKAYGPKGIGALWLRGGTRQTVLEPLFHGGGQEATLRPGTLNVPGIVGFGTACRLIRERGSAPADRVRALAATVLESLRAAFPDLILHGDEVHRLPGNLNFRIPGISAHALIAATPDLAFSAGAACHSGGAHPSHVLEALGLSAAEASGAIRLGLGFGNSEADVREACDRLVRAAKALRVSRTKP